MSIVNILFSLWIDNCLDLILLSCVNPGLGCLRYMLLRGHVPEDQLKFDQEIEKTARRNQSKKRKEKKKQG